MFGGNVRVIVYEVHTFAGFERVVHGQNDVVHVMVLLLQCDCISFNAFAASRRELKGCVCYACARRQPQRVERKPLWRTHQRTILRHHHSQHRERRRDHPLTPR
jgi:hypothetical protein